MLETQKSQSELPIHEQSAAISKPPTTINPFPCFPDKDDCNHKSEAQQISQTNEH